MSEAEKLFGKAIELIETKVYGDALQAFVFDPECIQWAKDCNCDISAVWEMAVWAVCELIPIEDEEIK